MRLNAFLRSPIKAIHQDRLQNLAIRETPLAGDPDLLAPAPQTLEIAFTINASIAEIQVAPLWSGSLRFRPDAGGPTPPTDPATITESAYPTWPVTGDLILVQSVPWAMAAAFAAHIPLIPMPPDVRYSRVVLTKDFIFKTLPTLQRQRFVFNGALVATDDPAFDAKRLIAFLRGQASVPCTHHETDPKQDDAIKAMPGVVLAAPGAETVLRISAATVAMEALDPRWFIEVPAYDGLSGVPLVRGAPTDPELQLHNFAHPSHSVIPARCLFAVARSTAFVSEASPTPLLSALTAPLFGASRYRRLVISRPPIPGPPVSSAPQRPHLCYKLCWKSAGGNTTECRLPLSGELYIPLEDRSYTWWVIPRTADSAVTLTGDRVRLCKPAVAPSRALGLPETVATVDVSSADTFTLYTSVPEFDAAYAWARFVEKTPRKNALKAKAAATWHAAVLDWYIGAPAVPPTPAREPYKAIYGMIRDSAGRHGLSPEFLQVVLFGEGAGEAIAALGAFNAQEVLSCYSWLGLDLILYRTGRLPPGAAPVPAGITKPKEVAEYGYNLVTAGYVDASYAALLTFKELIQRSEAGQAVSLHVGTVRGWAGAIELIAAELHARLDEMRAYCAAKTPAIPVVTEETCEFLSYVRFNSSPDTATQTADTLATKLKPWVGPPPPNNLNVIYNTIQRLAVVNWHEAVRAYR